MDNEISFLNLGGFLIWPIVIVGAMILMAGIERYIYITKLRINPKEFLLGIKNLLQKNRIKEAISMCEEAELPVSNIVKVVLTNLKTKTNGEIEQEIRSIALLEIPNIQRRIELLGLLTKMSCMVGLLLTVASYIFTFMKIRSTGVYIHPELLWAHVFQGMMSAFLGIFFTIIGWIFHYFLNSKVQELLYDIEWIGHEMLSLISRPDLEQIRKG